MNWHWGRKKKTSASSMTGKGLSSVTKMFHISWISKLRQGNDNKNERRISGRKAKDAKRNTWLQEEEQKSHRVEKFYKETEENFWRLSFSDECVQQRKSDVRGCPKSHNWLDETQFSPSESTCRGCGAKGVSKVVKEERQSMDFNDMLLDMSKLKNLELHQQSHGLHRGAKTANLKGADKKVAEGNSTIQHLDVKDIAEVEAVKPTKTSVRISRGSPISLSSQHQHYEAYTHSKLRGSECKNLGEVGEERKSIYINKGSLKRRSMSGRSNKVKVYSPRTPSKIRALEDLKKSRMKMRVKEKQVVVESLAVVKRSVDPQRDFRNSMLEMILDKGISQAEELEELLACYLILNSDEYHDMIIKVFRQVWFDLKRIILILH